MAVTSDQIKDLMALGIDGEKLPKVIEIFERDTSRHASHSVMMPNRSKAAIRAERYRNNLKQKQALAKANDIAKTDAQAVTERRDASRDGVTVPCDLSSLLPLSPSGIREVSKKETAVVVERDKPQKVSRGTRLDSASQISFEDHEFALAAGMTPARIKQAWAEFVDYWIGVPGSRGRKLNWSATWRNRVRQISTPGGPNGYGRSRPLQDDDKSISAAAGRLEEAAKRGEYTFGPRPSLLPEPNESPVFLLSKR